MFIILYGYGHVNALYNHQLVTGAALMAFPTALLRALSQK